MFYQISDCTISIHKIKTHFQNITKIGFFAKLKSVYNSQIK